MSDDLKARLAAASLDPDPAYAAEAKRRYRARYGGDPPAASNNMPGAVARLDDARTSPGPWAEEYILPTKPNPEEARVPMRGPHRETVPEGRLMDMPPPDQDWFSTWMDNIARSKESTAHKLVEPEYGRKVDAVVNATALGGLGAAVVGPVISGATTSVLPAGIAPMVAAAGTGATTGYAQGAAQRGMEGGATLRDMHEAGKEGAEFGAGAGPAGHVLGEGLSFFASLPGAVANWVRNSPTVTGSDIKALEKFGSSPAPIPGKATFNPPSTQLNQVASKRPDTPVVTASPHGRGVVGERGAKQLINEVEAQDRIVGQRLRNVELPAAKAKQGDRVISVQRYVDDIDATLDDPTVDGVPGLRSQLETTRKILTGELEPSVEVFTSPPKVAEVSGQRPAEVKQVGTWRTDLNRRVDPITGEAFIDPKVRPARLEHRGDIEPGRAVTAETTQEPEPFARVGLGVVDENGQVAGDIRGRVGDAPNYVMNAEKLNKLRDTLDELAGITQQTTGLSKKQHALAKIANDIRANVRREAPAIGLANRRHADAKSKIEKTRERMRTENDETLGMRLAKQTEEGSTAAGNREENLLELKRNFPTSPYMSRKDVDRVFDAPRALVAEERMRVLKPIGQVGGGTKYALNLQEPFVARGIYPGLRLSEASLRLGGDILNAGPAPVILNPLQMAIEDGRRRKRAPKRK